MGARSSQWGFPLPPSLRLPAARLDLHKLSLRCHALIFGFFVCFLRFVLAANTRLLFCTLVNTTVKPCRAVKRVRSRNNQSEQRRIHKSFHSHCFYVNICIFCSFFFACFFIFIEQTQTFAHATGGRREWGQQC